MIIAAAFAVLAFVRHPIYGLYLYLATVYVHPPSRWWATWFPTCAGHSPPQALPPWRYW